MEAAGLPQAFIATALTALPPTRDALEALPAMLGALCLTAAGLETVKTSGALFSLVRLFASGAYLRALQGECFVGFCKGWGFVFWGSGLLVWPLCFTGYNNPLNKAPVVAIYMYMMVAVCCAMDCISFKDQNLTPTACEIPPLPPNQPPTYTTICRRRRHSPWLRPGGAVPPRPRSQARPHHRPAGGAVRAVCAGGGDRAAATAA